MNKNEYWLRFLSPFGSAFVAALIFYIVPESYRYVYRLIAILLIFTNAFLVWIYRLSPKSQILWVILMFIAVGGIGIGAMFLQANNFWINLWLGLVASQISAVLVPLVIKKRANKNDAEEKVKI